MRKHLNNPWIVALLVLVALGVVVSALRGPGAERPPASFAAETEPEAVAEEAPRAPTTIAEALKALAVPAEVRDPFAPIARSGPDESMAIAPAAPEIVERLHLSASWVQGATVLLLVNGRVAVPGEPVGRCGIESADVTGAWIAHAGGRTFLPVGQVLSVRHSPSVTATLSVP